MDAYGDHHHGWGCGTAMVTLVFVLPKKAEGGPYITSAQRVLSVAFYRSVASQHDLNTALPFKQLLMTSAVCTAGMVFS